MTTTKKAIAIGTSAGGIDALDFLLPHLPAMTSAAIFVVLHISPDSDSYFLQIFNRKCKLKVKEACDTEEIKPGVIYFAPPGYHLLIEEDFTLTLNVDEKVNFSRPSIDLMFETAAEAFKKNLTGILLTGANSDGSIGLKTIKDLGGTTIVQDPKEARFPDMPLSALQLHSPDMILKLEDIARYFEKI